MTLLPRNIQGNFSSRIRVSGSCFPFSDRPAASDQRCTWFFPLVRSCLILFVVFLSGCETDYPWKLQDSATKVLVVDGIITNELKSHRINLSVSNSNPNAASLPVTGASVVVQDNHIVYPFTESSVTPGSYFSPPFQAVTGKTYVLTITYNETRYTAMDSMVAITELTPFSRSIVNNGNLYSYSHIKEGSPAMIEVTYDWTNNAAYTQTYGNSKAMETFYILTNVDINDVLSPDKEVIRFPAGTKVVRHKYSLSPAHQAFIRSLLMETEWRGGLFDVQQGNVTTNLSNGALGFFGVCMTLKDSVEIQ